MDLIKACKDKLLQAGVRHTIRCLLRPEHDEQGLSARFGEGSTGSLAVVPAAASFQGRAQDPSKLLLGIFWGFCTWTLKPPIKKGNGQPIFELES